MNFGGLKTRMSTLLRRKGKLKADNFLSVVAGGVVSLTMNEVYVHMVLRKSAEAGHITSKINDLVFISLSTLEALLAPFIGYFGKTRRTNLIAGSLLLTVLMTLPLMFLPFEDIDSTGFDLCGARVVLPLSASALTTFRIVIIILLAVSTNISKTTILAHGIALLDEHNPGKIPSYLAKIFGMRLLMWTSAYYFLHSMFESSVVIQAIALFAPVLLKACLVLLLYPTASMYDDDEDWKSRRSDGGFFSSLGRVLRNKTAIINMLSMGLILSSAWGVALYNSDIVKLKYHILVTNSDFYAGIVNGFIYFAVLFMVLVVGYNISSPILTEFNRVMIARKSIIYSIVAIAFLVTTLLLKCKTESIMRGVGGLNYTQPVCGINCGCSYPFNSYNPVCVLDDMTTYYSPCHAGCTVRQNVHGVSQLSNCLCSSNRGSAILGACDYFSCSKSYVSHQLILATFLGVVAIVLLLNLTSILRSIDPRDKSVGIGVTMSVIGVIAFVSGHLAFWQISELTCIWYEGGICELHSNKLVSYITIVTCTLAGISTLINIGLWISARISSRK